MCPLPQCLITTLHPSIVYIDAPHKADIETELDLFGTNNTLSNPRAWYTFEKINESSESYVGFDESMVRIKYVWETQGDFVGICGFSQGSTMAALVRLLEHLDFWYDVNTPLTFVFSKN